MTLAYTRTVSSARIEEEASPAVTTVTVEPSDAGGWWATGNSRFGTSGYGAD